jgi:uncharacterized protein YpiB (UPF0302 family)
MTRQADLREGPSEIHDLVAEIDEAIDRGDESAVEELSSKLRSLNPNLGAGSDT